MALDPSIILAGRSPNLLNSMAQGAQLASMQNDMAQQSQMRNFLRENGEAVFQGDQKALGQFAQYDPQGATSIDDRRQRLTLARQAAARAAAEDARKVDAQQAAEAAARIERAVAGGLQAQTPEQWDAYVASIGAENLVGQFENRELIAAQYLGVKDALEMARGDVRVQSSEILQDGTTVMVLSNGKTRVVSPDGQELSGQNAAAAIEQARQKRAEYERSVYGARREGTNVAEAETGTAAAAAGESGKLAVEASKEAFDQAGKMATSIGNIDDALDALARGGRAGAVDRFIPSITESSASLRNAMDRMGLDVIGAVTFGALSEGELRLAMETAVPRNLDEPQLKAWLERKRVAQQKTMDMLMDAAVFLGTPGNTIPTWIEKNRGARKPAGAARAPVQSGKYDAMPLEDLLNSLPETEADAAAWNRRWEALQ